LMLAPPAGPRPMIGIETSRPGGWRAAVIGPDGSLLEAAIVREDPSAKPGEELTEQAAEAEQSAEDGAAEAPDEAPATQEEPAEESAPAAEAESVAEAASVEQPVP